VIYLLALIIVIVDQGLKWLVRTHLAVGHLIPVLPPVLDLYHIQNPGGAFGILQHFRVLFVLVALLVIAVVIYVDYKYRPSLWTKVGMGLLLGGAIGNFLDRIITGTVTDYMYLAFIHFPIFNLADMSIDAGVIILLIRSIQSDKRNQELKNNDR
jgi:signal peptidase II